MSSGLQDERVVNYPIYSRAVLNLFFNGCLMGYEVQQIF